MCLAGIPLGQGHDGTAAAEADTEQEQSSREPSKRKRDDSEAQPAAGKQARAAAPGTRRSTRMAAQQQLPSDSEAAGVSFAFRPMQVQDLPGYMQSSCTSELSSSGDTITREDCLRGLSAQDAHRHAPMLSC